MHDTGTRLLLIRHAESEWNASGRWQGHGDPSLSSRGREQAKRLAESLLEQGQGGHLAALFSSDLRRARETAEALAAALGLEAQCDPDLRELDIGDWSGLRREQIEARDAAALERFESNDPDLRPGGGESRRQIRMRARRVVQRLVRDHPGQSIAVVTHLGFLRALIPGSDPANAECIRVSAREALIHREAELAEPLPPGAATRL